ncbi:MAG: NAD-dependent epimerase/dehydratase family protein [Kiloniellales bacterium]|nr:NAD-dependent epimerase/dehydratase family protein [Kiloniellales bacterium]
MAATVALTGASGFLGRVIIEHLLSRGWQVRALLRRPAPDLEAMGAISVAGALEERDSLKRLVEGADAVVHCAGLLKARHKGDFTAANVEGTERLAEAAVGCPHRPRFILLSSLAAREPAISPYAASKRGAEEALARTGGSLEWCSLRPPGVYGPGDRATLPLFRQMVRGFLLVPRVPQARLSLLHVQDLADIVDRLLAKRDWGGRTLEVDDGRDGGYGWADLAETASRHLKRRVRTVAVSRGLLLGPALANQWLAGAVGRSTFFTPGKLREFFHPDWVARPAADGPLGDWQARYTFETGFPATLEWYRAEGWL